MANYPYGNGLTLKALLENPDLQNPPVLNSSEKDKKDGDVFYDAGMAFLGPNLWDKTYTTEDFNLEYMDLDEFLGENGIPVNLDNVLGNDFNSLPLPLNNGTSNVTSEQNVQNAVPSPPSPPKEMSLLPPSPKSPVPPSMNTSPSTVKVPEILHGSLLEKAQSPSQSCRNTKIKSDIHVEFVVSPSDVALASIPGQEIFDPRKRAFSEDELKPQPMIKKSRKIFVPEDSKDDKYWQRRKKNNFAAKRSRDARRIKENQIAMRASFLEKQNDAMKIELEKMKEENLKLRTKLEKYEQVPAT